MDYGKSDTLFPILFLWKNILGWNRLIDFFFFKQVKFDDIKFGLEERSSEWKFNIISSKEPLKLFKEI